MSEQLKIKATQKNETGIHGKEYERHVLALIGVKCILDESIKDFWLMSNPEKIDKFDDVILFVEYKNGGKELFFIQLKHRLERDAGLLVPEIFEKEKKFPDLYLPKYRDAFTKIMKDGESFLKNHEINENVQKSFIIFTNRKVLVKEEGAYGLISPEEDKPIDEEDDKLRFVKCSKEKIKNFLNTNNTSKENVYGFHTCSDRYNSEELDKNFLDYILLYESQLHLDDINIEINSLLQLKIAESLIHYFYDLADPSKPKNNLKLTKTDIMIKLLELIFSGYNPSFIIENTWNNKAILPMLMEFDVIVINEQLSEKIIWNIIFQKIKTHNPMQFESWEETTTKLYLKLVAKSELPFFIKYDNNLFRTVCSFLLPKLKIRTVAFCDKKSTPSFSQRLKIFSNMNDLSETLLSNMTERIELSFQGKDKIDLCNTLNESGAEFKKQISTDAFFDLLLEKNLNIGEKNILPEYYINRKIKFPILNKSALIKENKWIFIICNVMHRLEIDSANTESLDTLIEAVNDKDILIEEKISECNVFTTDKSFNTDLAYELIKNKNIRNTIIFLKRISTISGFIIIHTNGKLKDLKPHILEQSINDEDLLNICSEVPNNIICNNAGAGKSMILRHIEKHYPSDVWVINVDLSRYEQKIRQIKTIKELCDFFYKAHKNKYKPIKFSKIYYSLYKYYLINKKLLWLIDNYEEINNPNFLKLLKEAANAGIRIWIVGRPFSKSKFENVFQIFSMELEEFGREEQLEFFKKYLTYKKFDYNIYRITEAINNTTTFFENNFIGICQQTKMLAEIFISNKLKLDSPRGVEYIYEEFISVGIEKSLENNNIDHQLLNMYKDKQFATISKMALYYFFSKDILQKAFDWEEFEHDLNIFNSEYKKHNLIIGYKNENSPIFSHLTYAEFLVAHWLTKTVQKQITGVTPFNVKELIKMLYYSELTTIRRFFDNMITKNIPLFSDIINNTDKSYSHFTRFNFGILPLDELGRNFIHILMSYGSERYDVQTKSETSRFLKNLDSDKCSCAISKERHIIRIVVPQPTRIFAKTKDVPDNLMKLLRTISLEAILQPDTFLGLRGLDCAIMAGSLIELNQILPNSLTNLNIQLDLQDKAYLLAYHCIKHKFNNLLRCLNLGRMNCHQVRDENNSSFLHLAIVSENLEVIPTLLNLRFLEDWGTDDEGNTPLHLACKNKDVVKIVFDFLKNHVMTLEYLNTANKKGRTLLHNLSHYGREKWVQQLVSMNGIKTDATCDRGNTPFMSSIMNNKLDVAKILMKTNQDINYGNHNGMTALHYAATKNFDQCCQYLLDNRAEVNCKNISGRTPLVMAARGGFEKIVKLLLKHGALVDKNAIQTAQRNKKYNVLKLLKKHNNNLLSD